MADCPVKRKWSTSGANHTIIVHCIGGSFTALFLRPWEHCKFSNRRVAQCYKILFKQDHVTFREVHLTTGIKFDGYLWAWTFKTRRNLTTLRTTLWEISCISWIVSTCTFVHPTQFSPWDRVRADGEGRVGMRHDQICLRCQLARSFNTICTPLESCFFSFETRGCRCDLTVSETPGTELSSKLQEKESMSRNWIQNSFKVLDNRVQNSSSSRFKVVTQHISKMDCVTNDKPHLATTKAPLFTLHQSNNIRGSVLSSSSLLNNTSSIWQERHH